MKAIKEQAAKKAYNMLYECQYKQIEKILMSNLSKANQEKYKKLGYLKKIIVLDNCARYLGL